MTTRKTGFTTEEDHAKHRERKLASAEAEKRDEEPVSTRRKRQEEAEAKKSEEQEPGRREGNSLTRGKKEGSQEAEEGVQPGERGEKHRPKRHMQERRQLKQRQKPKP